MKKKLTKKQRSDLMNKINFGVAKNLGMLETNDGILYLVQIGNLVLGGTACNVGLLIDWGDVIELENSFQDPAESYVDENEIELFTEE